jgi:predicted nucleic acid-binding Zn ribbon protein
MPSYDYHCEANDRVVEVRHSINDKLTTWGEVCEKANIETGDTPANTPVQRMITGGGIVGSSALSTPEPPSCGGGGCGGGMCGL